MMRTMLRAKLHRLTVTETNVDYEGSITIDKKLLTAADILPGEKVHVVDVNNGARFETYTLEGGAGEVCINGAAARLASVGDKVIVIAYAIVDEKEVGGIDQKIIHVDERNRIK